MGQLLDRLEALGATFCEECYAYLWPEHAHLTRGPVVPVAHCQLAEPIVIQGADGQSEIVMRQAPLFHTHYPVTIQEEEAA